MPNATLWDLKRHTAAKHEILRAYLSAWFPILGSAHGRVIFVDGFAGPGEYAGGEPGSPLVALEAASLHAHRLADRELMFLFIEEDADRHRHLDGLISAREAAGDIPENFYYRTIHGSFADVVGRVVGSLRRNQLAPAFVMIDPFGVKGIPYELIRDLASYPRTELLISFMYEPIARFMATAEFESHLDALFGRPDWRAARRMDDSRQKSAYLHDLFMDQIKFAGMDYVRSFRMLDEGGRTEYFLFFATHNIKGLDVMKDAMWSVDPSGTYRFSDVTDPDQLVMFQLDPDYGQLRSAVQGRFSGQTVSIQEIEHFVIADTPFRKSHLRKNALDILDDEGHIHVTGRKKRHTYPEGTLVTFP